MLDPGVGGGAGAARRAGRPPSRPPRCAAKGLSRATRRRRSPCASACRTARPSASRARRPSRPSDLLQSGTGPPAGAESRPERSVTRGSAHRRARAHAHPRRRDGHRAHAPRLHAAAARRSGTSPTPTSSAQIHRAYYAAGADIVHTNTFGGTRIKLAALRPRRRRGGVQRGGRASSPSRYATAVPRPPGGRRHRLDRQVPQADGRPRAGRAARRLRRAGRGAGSRAASTSSASRRCTTSPRRAWPSRRRAARAPALPVLASMTFKRGPRGYRTMMGVDPRLAVATLLAAGRRRGGLQLQHRRPKR